jgi:RNA polymerase-binding transcription factor
MLCHHGGVRDDAIKAVLEERRRQLSGELVELTKPPPPGQNLSFGKRIGDGTTEAVERISSTAAARSIAAALADVERALVKLDEGTYGVCESCGRPIGEERLAAIPSAVFCVSCSARRPR